MIELSISETVLAQIAIRRMQKEDLSPNDRMIYEGIMMKLNLSETGMMVHESINSKVNEIMEKTERQKPKPVRITFSGTVDGIR